jgi:hypothetical protein
MSLIDLRGKREGANQGREGTNQGSDEANQKGKERGSLARREERKRAVKSRRNIKDKKRNTHALRL